MNRRQTTLKFSTFVHHLNVSALKIAALALLLSAGWTASAQNPFFLTSSTDGNGLFTYTFSPGDANFVMGLQPGLGQVSIPSYGVLSFTTPAGWTASVANDVVTWQPLSGPIFLGTPSLTVSIQSSSIETALYSNYPPFNGPYSSGLVGGFAHFLDEAGQNSDGEGAPGFLTFSFMGPAIIPEPSSLGLLFPAVLMVVSRSIFFGRATKRS